MDRNGPPYKEIHPLAVGFLDFYPDVPALILDVCKVYHLSLEPLHIEGLNDLYRFIGKIQKRERDVFMGEDALEHAYRETVIGGGISAASW